MTLVASIGTTTPSAGIPAEDPHEEHPLEYVEVPIVSAIGTYEVGVADEQPPHGEQPLHAGAATGTWIVFATR